MSVIELKQRKVDDRSLSLLHVIDLACLFKPISLIQHIIRFLVEIVDSARLLDLQVLSMEEGVQLCYNRGLVLVILAAGNLLFR